MRLILASASPRRAELLTAAGFTFTVAPAGVDETARPGEEPALYALRVARDKASAAAAHGAGGEVVLAADTVVVVEGGILGKPRDRDDAGRMLEALSGRSHDVLTAVVLRDRASERSEVVTTRVHVTALNAAELSWYLGTGEWEGKAGGYAIQGIAARYIERIEGSWSNVVGLPIATVHRLVKGAGGDVIEM